MKLQAVRDKANGEITDTLEWKRRLLKKPKLWCTIRPDSLRAQARTRTHTSTKHSNALPVGINMVPYLLEFPDSKGQQTLAGCLFSLPGQHVPLSHFQCRHASTPRKINHFTAFTQWIGPDAIEWCTSSAAMTHTMSVLLWDGAPVVPFGITSVSFVSCSWPRSALWT